MRYGSVCSGIEAASVAWHPLGWRASFLSEIEAFPRAVLSHHYQEVPLHGDFTTIRAGEYEPIDLLVGGTPCQSFSVAGLRGRLDDERGNLALEYLRLAQRLRPRWLVWENVPGVLSSGKGRDFGAILGGMVELGYGFAYRVLDAQYVRVDGFGRAVPQRRRRVFVVGHLGDWRRAAAVLFEPESLSGNPAPRRQAGQGIAHDVASCVGASGRGFERAGETRGQDPVIAVADVASTLNAHFGNKQGLEDQHINGGGRSLLPPVSLCLNAGGMGRIDSESETLIPTHGAAFDVAHSLKAEGFDASEDGTGRGTPIVPVAFDCKGTEVQFADDGSHPPLRSMGHNKSHSNAGGHAAVAIQERAVSENLDNGPGGSGISTDGAAYTLEARNKVQAVQYGWRVRRLTPTECERLQGFPEILDRVTINVWHSSDLHQNSAIAESLNLKSQNSVSPVEGGDCAPSVSYADSRLSTSLPGPALPVVLHVLINLERGEVQFRSAEKLIWSANIAAKPSASPLSMPLDGFVRLAALMTQTAVPPTTHGRVELPASIRSSSPALLGSACVNAYGREIAELAADAETFTTAMESSMRSITSPSGQGSRNCDLSLRTLSSCVIAATSSCIQNSTLQASSYAVIVETTRGYTNIPYRNRTDAPDGPRYKALGNSMAVNVMRWIGTRIQMVEGAR